MPGHGVLSGDEGTGTPEGEPVKLASFPAGGPVDDLSARGDLVIWERPGFGRASGARLRERAKGRVRNLPMQASPNYAGVELGTDAAGHSVAIYSRCAAKYSCQVYTYRFDTGAERLVPGVSQSGCDEFGAAISGGVISFGRGPRGTGLEARCRGGVYVRLPDREPKRITNRIPRDTDVNGRLVAWWTRSNDLRVARIGRRIVSRTITPEGDDAGRREFLRAVLDGSFVYFVDHVFEDPDEGVSESYSILRTTATVRPAALERYGRAVGVSFRSLPVFAVGGGDLLYSADDPSNPDDGSSLIARDASPAFRSKPVSLP